MSVPRWLVVLVAALLGWLARRPYADPCDELTLLGSNPALGEAQTRDLVAVVTGATGGIGLGAVDKLARLGVGTIYLTGRTQESAEAAVAKFGSKQVVPMAMDLGDLATVVEFARFVSLKHAKVDILINNAAVVRCPYGETSNGFEKQVGINHLGHYLLTRLLLPKLTNSTRGGRIVHVASRSADWGEIDPSRWRYSMAGAGERSAGQFYGDSKLAQVAFSFELARRLSERSVVDGRPLVTSNAVHPGVALTGATRHLIADDFKPLVQGVAAVLTAFGFIDSLKACVATPVALALSPEMNSLTGAFVSKCKPRYVKSKHLYDMNALKLVWDASQFYVDPEGVLFSDGLDVKPLEDWSLYSPPEEVTSFDEFNFASKFAAWKVEKDKLAKSAEVLDAAHSAVHHLNNKTQTVNEEESCSEAIKRALESHAEKEPIVINKEELCEEEIARALEDVEANNRCDERPLYIGCMAREQKCLEQVRAFTNAHAAATKDLKECEEKMRAESADETLQARLDECLNKAKLLQEVRAELETCNAAHHIKSVDVEVNTTCPDTQSTADLEKLDTCTKLLETVEESRSSLTRSLEECETKAKTLEEDSSSELLGCTNKIKDLEAQQTESAKKIDDCKSSETECSAEKKRLEEKVAGCEKLQEEASDMQTSLERCISERDSSKSELETTKDTLAKTLKDLENATQTNDELESNLAKCENDAKEASFACSDKLAGELIRLEKEIETQVESIQNKLIQCQQDQAKLDTEIDSLTSDLDSCRSSLNGRIEDVEQSKKELEECKARDNSSSDDDKEQQCESKLKLVQANEERLKESLELCEKSEVSARKRGEEIEEEVQREIERAKEKIADLAKLDSDIGEEDEDELDDEATLE